MELVLDQHAALGTAWWVEANLKSTRDREQIQDALIAHLNRFEMRYSRFRTDSLIGRLNEERVLEVPDAELQSILSFGQSLFSRTRGTFNFLLGDILTERGYGQSHPSGRNRDRSSAQLPNPTTDLVISSEKIILKNGSVDLGGFGKGYVIDELAALLRDNGVTDFLINGGGDLFGTTDCDAPITVYLEHPTAAHTYLGSITLHNQGFAASSPYKRTWTFGKQMHTHIVGNTTFATYVTGPTAAIADAFATAALLLSETDLIQYANKESLGFARYEPTTSTLTRHQLTIANL